MSPLDLSNQIPHSNTLSKELGVRRTLSSYKPWGFFSQRCSCTQRDHPLLMRTCCLEKSFSCSWCFWVYRFPKNHWTLQWRGGRLCIAKFRDLQTTSFEIPWFLGLYQFHRISPINLLNSMNFTPFSTQALLFWSSQSLWKVRNLQISQAVMIQKQSSQLSPETKCTNKTKEEERIIFLLHLQISTSTFQFGCQWKTLRDGGLTACNGIIWHPLEGPGMKHLLPHLLGNVYVSGVLRNLHTTWSTWVLRIIQHQYPFIKTRLPKKTQPQTPRDGFVFQGTQIVPKRPQVASEEFAEHYQWQWMYPDPVTWDPKGKPFQKENQSNHQFSTCGNLSFREGIF